VSAAEVLKDNESAIPLVSQISAELPDVVPHIENDVYFSRLQKFSEMGAAPNLQAPSPKMLFHLPFHEF
jgi:hypothetical protein